MKNIDPSTVESFGNEWKRFNQATVSNDELAKNFNDYFEIFPWDIIGEDSIGFDMGCGSGRWAKFVAPKVKYLNCIDPSESIAVAKKNLKEFTNVEFIARSVSDDVLAENSQDFGYSLGVLHHVPDTPKAIESCVKFLKPDAPFLVYLYYSFDNKSLAYRGIWRLTDIFRRIISRLPSKVKDIITDIIALTVYFPLAKLSKLMDFLKINIESVPLSYYRNHSFYTMRTDSRDRFGTPLEKRFSKNEIKRMMLDSGLTNIKFSTNQPFWCAIGFKSVNKLI
jgi:ubiquinone/menaquinone biosynthesis C-methylase UbiE